MAVAAKIGLVDQPRGAALKVIRAQEHLESMRSEIRSLKDRGSNLVKSLKRIRGAIQDSVDSPERERLKQLERENKWT